MPPSFLQQPLYALQYTGPPFSTKDLTTSAQRRGQGPQGSHPFPGCHGAGGQCCGACGHWPEATLQLISLSQPTGKVVGGTSGLYLTRGWGFLMLFPTHCTSPYPLPPTFTIGSLVGGPKVWGPHTAQAPAFVFLAAQRGGGENLPCLLDLLSTHLANWDTGVSD